MSWTGELLDLLLFQDIAIDIIYEQKKPNQPNKPQTKNHYAFRAETQFKKKKKITFTDIADHWQSHQNHTVELRTLKGDSQDQFWCF